MKKPYTPPTLTAHGAAVQVTLGTGLWFTELTGWRRPRP